MGLGRPTYFICAVHALNYERYNIHVKMNYITLKICTFNVVYQGTRKKVGPADQLFEFLLITVNSNCLFANGGIK